MLTSPDGLCGKTQGWQWRKCVVFMHGKEPGLGTFTALCNITGGSTQADVL